MSETTFADAVREGLAEEMRRDSLVWALGEDLSTGHQGTSGTHYEGLIDEFGPRRIVNTPISENTIMGAAVGAAVAGTRPIADLRMADFGMCAVDELVNQAAKIRYMFGGQARVPLVVRQAIGMRKGAAAQHSQSTEAWFVHTPGLIVVAPSTPADGKGLLKAAIRCDDPVVLMEHKELWATTGDVVEGEASLLPIGKAKTLLEGTGLTIVSWSKMTRLAVEAAEALSRDGASVEVIDLRTPCGPGTKSPSTRPCARPSAFLSRTSRSRWAASGPRSRPTWRRPARARWPPSCIESAPPACPPPMPRRWKTSTGSRRNASPPAPARPWRRKRYSPATPQPDYRGRNRQWRFGYGQAFARS